MKERVLILGSGSPARRTLLESLQLPFTIIKPDIDEAANPGENAQTLTHRLALEKSHAIANMVSQPALIVTCDQVGELGTRILDKPHTHERAIEQLLAVSNQPITFYTSMCLFDNQSGERLIDTEPFSVHFRELTEVEIDIYLQLEQPYQCAGAFRSEGLGATLVKRFAGEDPNALIGLPVIKLTQMLKEMGYHPLKPHTRALIHQ